MQYCACGSQKLETYCCVRIMATQEAETAEALMRSRYTAFAKQNIAYILATTAKESRSNVSLNQLNEFVQQAHFTRLDILDRIDGGMSDQTGIVEFKAHYHLDGKHDVIHERSFFQRENGMWRYVEGSHYETSPVKLSRNSPCPCGSGKKYKHCCIRK